MSAATHITVRVPLDGRQPSDLGLPRLLKPFPIEWERQWAEIQDESKSKSAS
jgi:hypothetical protein